MKLTTVRYGIALITTLLPGRIALGGETDVLPHIVCDVPGQQMVQRYLNDQIIAALDQGR